MRLVLFAFLTALISHSCAHKQKKADFVLHNATIYLVDDEFRTSKAMAIVDGKIVEIGAEREILNKYRADRFFDAGGRAVIPALYSDDPVQDLIRLVEGGAAGYPMDIKEAILTLSSWEAKQRMEDDTKGFIKVGYLANFMVLNGDPVAGTALSKTEVGAIFLEGEQIFP